MSCWDEVVWKDYTQEIDKAITDCRREAGFGAWMPEQASTSEKKIAYVRFLLQELVSDIKDETISVGEPLDYTTLQNQLGYIGESISQVDKELQRQVLLYLALEGGGVCGTGIYEQVEVAAHKLLMTSQLAGKLSLKRRIFLQLRQERERIVHALYLHWHKLFKSSISPEDNVHHMSLFKLIFARDFGIEDEGARNDVTLRIKAWIEEILERAANRRLGDCLKIDAENLWEDVKRFQKDHLGPNKHCWELNRGYTSQRILQTVKDSINNHVIAASDFYVWIHNWMKAKAKEAIEAQKLTPAEIAARVSEFEGRLFDLDFQPFIGSVGGLGERCLILMLIDMGVLSIKKKEPLLVDASGDPLL